MEGPNDWRLRNAEMAPASSVELGERAPWLKACAFCRKSVQSKQNDFRRRWYVSPDLSRCVCAHCFRDLKDRFQWKTADGSSLDGTPRFPHCGRDLHISGDQDYPYSCPDCKVLVEWDLGDEVYVGKPPCPFCKAAKKAGAARPPLGFRSA